MTNTITKNPKQNLDKKDSEKEMILKGGYLQRNKGKLLIMTRSGKNFLNNKKSSKMLKLIHALMQ